MKTTNALKLPGIVMIVFAAVYAVVGTLALMGMINGALPGHENQEMLVIILSYAVAFFALICGIVCVKGMTGMAKVFGAVFAAAGLAALIYLQISQGAFSIFDCLAVCYGVLIYCIASKAE